MLSVVRDENAQKKTPACWLCCERFINKTGENKVVSDEDFESMACWLRWHFLKKRRQKRLMRADKKAENSGSGTNMLLKGFKVYKG